MTLVLLCIFLFFFSVPSQSQIVINEIMQSNVDCVMDDLNEFPDSWVELYNKSDHAVTLSNYKLGNDYSVSSAWSLPERLLQPGEHLLIYCDKVGSNTETGIHTDFRLESGKGGSVFLFHGNDIADWILSLMKQPAPNVAYGRKTDGNEVWGYMMQPTPGAANCGSLSDGVLGEPIFSHVGSIMQEGEALNLDINVPQNMPDGTVVRYTTDCSEPTTSSPVFTGPITITSNTVIRATLFCEGWLSPRSSVQSYIFFPTDHPLTLSVVSLATDSRYLYDDQIGIYVDGAYQSDKKNWKFDWRRPANFEFFETMAQPSALNQLGEIRVAGGASREFRRKSLAVYANKRFGKNRLKYEFFPEQRPGMTDYKSLLLRNAGNDFIGFYMRDAAIQRVMASHVDMDWQAYRPVIVYLNGEYTGILNIRERSNADNIYTNYDGLEDIDMLESGFTLKEGTMDNMNKFRKFYAEEGHTLEEYQQWMDCEEYANLMIANIYFDNADFAGGNTVLWRPRAEGGRWRWLAKDMDYTLGYIYDSDYNTIKWLYDNSYDAIRAWANLPEYTVLFRHLMDDPAFRKLFCERFAIYMGDFLNERGIHAVWDSMYDYIYKEYAIHRWNLRWYYTYIKYDESIIDTWLSQRTDYVYKYLQDFYHLEPLIPFVIEKHLEDDESAEILFNGIKLSEGLFNGKFYQGREVILQGSTESDKEVTGWIVTTESETGDENTAVIPGDTYVFTVPECSKLIVRPLIGIDPTGVSDFKAKGSISNGWYSLDGRHLNEKPSRSGIYIHNGKKIVW